MAQGGGEAQTHEVLGGQQDGEGEHVERPDVVHEATRQEQKEQQPNPVHDGHDVQSDTDHYHRHHVTDLGRKTGDCLGNFR